MYREDSVTEAALDIAELVGGRDEVLVRWKGGSGWGGHVCFFFCFVIDWLDLSLSEFRCLVWFDWWDWLIREKGGGFFWKRDDESAPMNLLCVVWSLLSVVVSAWERNPCIPPKVIAGSVDLVICWPYQLYPFFLIYPSKWPVIFQANQ